MGQSLWATPTGGSDQGQPGALAAGKYVPPGSQWPGSECGQCAQQSPLPHGPLPSGSSHGDPRICMHHPAAQPCLPECQAALGPSAGPSLLPADSRGGGVAGRGRQAECRGERWLPAPPGALPPRRGRGLHPHPQVMAREPTRPQLACSRASLKGSSRGQGRGWGRARPFCGSPISQMGHPRPGR